MHSRIDYFLLNTIARHRVRECSTGTSDISKHNIFYLTIHPKNRPKNTLWRLYIDTLNNEAVVKLIKEKISDCLGNNNDGQGVPSMLWDTVKAIMRGRLISRSA